ncbi:hypothetical protein [Streptomyces sp. MST-110588]|uniref:hypothetical protein n=1 Tax=Streptomyces sp. MST-110588 TaxID=2833628 RepID=UPI001F5C46DF|nr:hypothetical protein [Streptomyces sp. MST-110588]UNO38844.1 hypothetical protein KGS77_03280 [Streptomyces sp. MST-110588]
MNSLNFFADVVASGTVLGASPTCGPDQVSEVLGTDYAENSGYSDSMWRDYGLAEFFWFRGSADAPWEGHHFSLQVHRLTQGPDVVAPAIRSVYGQEFGPTLAFDALAAVLRERGVPLEEIPDTANAPYYRSFWQPQSCVEISVIAEHSEFLTPDDLSVGDVYRIGAPLHADVVAGRRARR